MISFSQYKSFYGHNGCEARGLAIQKKEWVEKKTDALLVGGYIDAYFEGAESLEKFKLENPGIFKKDGELKADYRKADEIIEKIQNDDIFMQFCEGEKQKKFFGKYLGHEFHVRLDFYDEGQKIVDLKIIADIRKKYLLYGLGYTNFVRANDYDLQLAIYQKIVEQNTGKRLDCYIAVADKGEYTDIEIIRLTQKNLDEALEKVTTKKLDRIEKLKQGEAKPIKCGGCNYCKATKKIIRPINLDELKVC